MKKDVIYIDIEDDITSIIGKVKDSTAKVVAIVPPKRVGVLQSAVNLKLLQRAAQGADKHVVLITNDKSLSALAAGIQMPIAKNLQSKPEVPAIEALEVDDNDVINGEELPIGELAGTAAPVAAAAIGVSATKAAKDAGESLESVDDIKPVADTKKSKKGVKVPNFDIFRKRIFIFSGLGVLLVIFLVWAIFFAPRATVTITARTNDVSVNEAITLDPDKETNVEDNQLQPIVKQIKKSGSQEFEATGEKEIGEKASGNIDVTNCEYPLGFTIPAGTTFRSQSDLEFTNSEAVSLPGYTQQSQCSQTTRSVAVVADEFGPEYNLQPQTYQIGGVSGNVTAQGGQMSGGTRKTVKVVSQADVDKAKEAISEEDSAVDAVEQELRAEFDPTDIIIAESLSSETGDPEVSPKVGQEASKGQLTVETTYTLLGLSRTDVQAFLTAKVNEQIKDQPDRQIYTVGDDTVRFAQFQKDDDSFSATIIATAAVGPKIDSEQLAKDLAGKNFGEIDQTVRSIEGVDDVKVDFSPFWVNKAPSAEKIEIKFSIVDEN